MKDDQITLREWYNKFQNGDFDKPDVETQIEAGWFDWFCKDEYLRGKTQILGKKVGTIINSPKIKPDEQYIFFKNNCPVNGKLYDSFSICDMKTEEVIYWVCPSQGHKHIKGLAEVYGSENNFKEYLASGKWKDIRAFFKTAKSL